jgi:RNA-directed DNA polymerase
MAYRKLYANKGATMKGTVETDTVDGMSFMRIDDILDKLENGTYTWRPVRRIYIPKAMGKIRPLGIPCWSDKLVQEVLKMVMEAYYEPIFRESSHGVRPNRGCHTALSTICNHWRGTKWFIEGDIKGCFDQIDHEILLPLIGKRIEDARFLKLLRAMLKAGYMEDWKWKHTYSGTPQGGILSPLGSSNIIIYPI